MSNAVLPSFAGQKWPFTRSPKFSTTVETSVSGREFRTSNWSYPKYEWKLDFEVLRETGSLTEMRQLMGFINARGGSFDSFLFTDPDDNAVTLQALGVGNGVATQFQLVRTWGGYVEPVFDANGTVLVYVNGVLRTLTTHYTISSTGLITFVTPPPNGHAVTATFNFYWRVRFLKDGYDFGQVMQDLWDLRGLTFITFKP